MTVTRSRRQIIATLALLCVIAGSGCVTTNPTVAVDTSASTVFEDVSANEPWTTRSLSTTITLNETATTEQGVGELVVIAADGTSFDSVPLDAGQTSATVYVPPNQNATLVAVNTINGTIVERRSVVPGGHRIP